MRLSRRHEERPAVDNRLKLSEAKQRCRLQVSQHINMCLHHNNISIEKEILTLCTINKTFLKSKTLLTQEAS